MDTLFAFRLRFSLFGFVLRHSNEAEYRILTFQILFRHSHWGRISHFNIRKLISTFEFRPNIMFLFSFFAFRLFDLRLNSEFWHSKSYFDIRTEAEYRILTFENLFRHSAWCRISYFNIRNPILTFELRPNIVFWHSKSYFNIQTKAEYRILTIEILI